MKTIRIKNEYDIEQVEDTVLVLGYFDGLHQGHRALFAEARKLAKEQGLKIALLTFPESPKLAFVRYKPDLLLHLSTPEERAAQLADLGVDYFYLIDFTSRFARHTAQEFFDKYVKRLKARALVAGFDYHFGSDCKGVEDLATYFSGPFVVVPAVTEQGEKVSSTRIRQTILAGQVAQAAKLLGHPLSTRGMVVHGDARGRTIGFPTANLAPLDRVILPADGVYVVEVEHDGKLYRGMASVGKNMTFEGTELRFEANIFDFSQDIYGDTIQVFWLDKIRDMVKFDSVEALVEQLEADEKFARQWKN
ncbi:bifunctional riboflavin kinase/FAD synthetase [Streptococcus oricebi]|uniref:Riboflavin biosynthesis protein n=1 Tax=Streptococcus oricebi TaxID=1547447 RepID=A0ABS5B2N7_9STRE|nr:bifunctional riboflavin kinase/FAD synthetase [Streptococcus oricebi]MBP2623093.1 bifunctional riboflavin kinase/FAD synthetase [Streptococcus oricebi]